MTAPRDLVEPFIDAFGAPPTHAADAPGRVNLIGEHTDYNAGFVLPMAIDRRALILARPRGDTTVRLRSTAMPGQAAFDLSARLKPDEPKWANYVKGPIAGCVERGLWPGGFDALLHCDVPAGGGLSSSAAIEVAAATLVESLCARSLDPADKALLAQQAEHDFAGVPCGIMDQFAAVFAKAGCALLLDCRSHEVQHVPLDDPAVTVLIINSGVTHELADGAYAQRRKSCEQAARVLGVETLRDATMQQLEAAGDKLDEATCRCARHVIGETARTADAAERLRQRDYTGFGKLMADSHASLRDDYRVSCAELDLLVELATQQEGAFGSRMTGGGFGGCTVTLAAADKAPAIQAAVCAAYQQRTGRTPGAFVTRPGEGARVLRV